MPELGNSVAPSPYCGGPASWGSSSTTWRAFCSLYPRFWLKHWCMAFHSPTEIGNIGIDLLSLIQTYHAPQGIRMAEILVGRNIKSMCFCGFSEWLYFNLHTKLCNTISQKERVWKLVGDMLKSQSSDFILGSKYRLLKWLSSLTPASFSRDRPAISMLNYWCSEKSGQRVAQAVSMSETQLCSKTGSSDPTSDPFCLPPCFRSVLIPQLGDLYTYTAHSCDFHES